MATVLFIRISQNLMTVSISSNIPPRKDHRQSAILKVGWKGLFLGKNISYCLIFCSKNSEILLDCIIFLIFSWKDANFSNFVFYFFIFFRCLLRFLKCFLTASSDFWCKNKSANWDLTAHHTRSREAVCTNFDQFSQPFRSEICLWSNLQIPEESLVPEKIKN